MKLKRLELEGFKSFADKTVLNFDSVITGVVGPNGCGKSNVVDAIRWVMGEQSAKHLRGKHMEDVIFAGAKDRDQGSCAHVELTFSTAGAQTPPQYENCEEISIGRKLYRNGDSEYLVNKQIVRLKDVRDLFLGTGVGANAYSIIEQGSIGALVTSKPEDRRKIIEEAAGISKFQMRKAAAERRMEATEQNLLRLKDVLAELERQKRSLERQAKKAERFRVIKDELTDLDLKVSAHDYDIYSKREAEQLGVLKDKGQSLTQAEAELQEHENDFEKIRLEQTQKESQVMDLQQKIYEWNNILNVSETKLQSRRDEKERAKQHIVEEDSQTQKFRDLILAGEVERDDLVEKSLSAQLDFLEKESVVLELEADFQETQTLSQKLFEDLKTARLQSQQSSESLTKIEAQKSMMTEKLDEVRNQKIQNEAKQQELGTKVSVIERELGQSQNFLSDVKQLKFSIEQKREQVVSRLEELKSELSKETTELESIKEELLAKKSRLQSLRELERNFEGYQDGPKTMLEKKRAGEADYISGAIAEFVDSEPEFENAISAVLGDRAQCLVVDQPAQTVTGAGLLKELNSGRSSFVASAVAYDESEVYARELEPNLQGRPGYRGLLKNHVQFKAGYENLKNVFLSDYVLVDGLNEGLNIWEQYKCPVVTLDGETISREGIVSGGSVENTSKALFEKKREIRDLDVLVQQLVNRVKDKEEHLFDLGRKSKSLEADLEDVRKSQHEEEIRIANREKDLEMIKKDYKSMKDDYQELGNQIQSLSERKKSLEEELTELSGRFEEESEKKNSAEKLLNEHENDEERYKEMLAEKSANLTQHKIDLAKLQNQYEDLERELTRLTDNMWSWQLEVIRAAERRSLWRKREIFLIRRIQYLEKFIAKVLEEREKLDDQYQVEKNEFEKMQQRLFDEEVVLKDLRKKESTLKEEINKVTLQLSDVRNRLSRLQEQCLERYQVAIKSDYLNYLVTAENTDEESPFVYEDAIVRVDELREKLQSAGNVNLEAIDELKDVVERFEFLDKQRVDLEESLSSLAKAIDKINETTRQRFRETYDLVNDKFATLFPRLFRGGEARLELTDPENILETGVDIIAQPPGKRLQSISLLSGGEKALTAVSLLFAIFLIKPSPFCLLDEVDAPLDDANVDRYNEIVHEMSQKTQFVVITHNKRTMQSTEALFGVTMERKGISKLVSVSFDE